MSDYKYTNASCAPKYEDSLAHVNSKLTTERWFSITINPPDDLQYWSSQDRIKDFIKGFVSRYCPLSNYTQACMLHGEVSPNGRLHVHGMMDFKDTRQLLSFYINYLHVLGLHCSYDIKVIADADNLQTWLDYCNKQKLFVITTDDLKTEYNHLTSWNNKVIPGVKYSKIPMQ